MNNFKGWFPSNSETQVNEDNSLTITPPEEWIYVGFNNEGNIERTAGGGSSTVSCTCNVEGSCSPFTGWGPGGSTSGCAGGCTDCSMKQSISNTPILEGGYLKLEEEARILDLGEELPAAFKAMYEIAEVVDKIDSFLNEKFQGEPIPEATIENNIATLPAGYLFAVVNICSRATVLPVPEAAMSGSNAGGDEATCSCTEGSCSLKSKSIGLAGAKWCEGSCTGTCTLSTISNTGGTPEETYSAVCFQF